MTSNPTFSVIIPTLNEEKFLPNLLESLVEQTKKDFEVLVVDGSSKDKTVNVAKSFERKLPKLHVVVSKKASLPLQRNLGAQVAQGKWFIFVDADSVFLPYFIEQSGKYIDTYHPQLFTIWSRPDSEVNGDAVITLLINLFWEGSLLFNRQLAPGPLAIVTREAFEKVRGYDESLMWGEDFDFAQRLKKEGIRLHILRETLFSVSLRRFRKEGNLKALQMYAKAGLLVLLTKRPPKQVPGYIMGGHFYGRRKPVKRSALRVYERKLKQLMKELFG